MSDYLHGTAILVGSPLGTGYYVGDDAPRALRKGMRGDDVKSLQQALTAAGFDTKGSDGVFGSNTESAVRSFQKAKGLSVDGVAGAATLKALGLSGGGELPGGPARPAQEDATPDMLALGPSSPMRSFTAALTRKYGPLPLYGWGFLTAAAGGCAYLLRPSRIAVAG
jgi:hypothetical protein